MTKLSSILFLLVCNGVAGELARSPQHRRTAVGDRGSIVPSEAPSAVYVEDVESVSKSDKSKGSKGKGSKTKSSKVDKKMKYLAMYADEASEESDSKSAKSGESTKESKSVKADGSDKSEKSVKSVKTEKSKFRNYNSCSFLQLSIGFSKTTFFLFQQVQRQFPLLSLMTLSQANPRPTRSHILQRTQSLLQRILNNSLR